MIRQTDSQQQSTVKQHAANNGQHDPDSISSAKGLMTIKFPIGRRAWQMWRLSYGARRKAMLAFLLHGRANEATANS